METIVRVKSLQEINEELEKSIKIMMGIDIIDNLIGGLFAGQIHSILGESGVGKSWFCQQAIHSLLTSDRNANVIYSDFSGNIRFQNLKKTLNCEEFLDQVNFFHPNSILENIILIKKIVEGQYSDISLLILDTIFGSPMQLIELFGESKKKWTRNIFNFMLDLRKIAIRRNIPIIIAHHAFSDASKELASKDRLIDPFCMTKSVLHKSSNGSSLDFYIYNQFLGSTTIKLYSDRDEDLE